MGIFKQKSKRASTLEIDKKESRKRKTLVRDFDEIIKQGDIESLKKVFNKCQVNAYDTFTENNALSYDYLSQEFVKWLVENGTDVNYVGRWKKTPLHYQAQYSYSPIQLFIDLGADLEAKDYRGSTPLHYAAESFKFDNVKVLVEAGSDVHAKNKDSLTPLETMLQQTGGIDIAQVYMIAEYLLQNGARMTKRMQDFVTKIGTDYELYRCDPREYDEETRVLMQKNDQALQKLYKLFHVTPIAKRQIYDGHSPITIQSQTWQKQHQELWELLVPGSGSATTVQGEVIRISGKVSYEILDNGGVNWDLEYCKLGRALLQYFHMGKPLDDCLYSEVEQVLSKLPNGVDEKQVARLSEVSVLWVLANPQPLALKQPDYKR